LATRTIKSSISSEIDLTITSERLGIYCARHFCRVRALMDGDVRGGLSHRATQCLFDRLGHLDASGPGNTGLPARSRAYLACCRSSGTTGSGARACAALDARSPGQHRALSHLRCMVRRSCSASPFPRNPNASARIHAFRRC
jgi:hypothetical protein